MGGKNSGLRTWKIQDKEELKDLMRRFSNNIVAKKLGVSRQCIYQHRQKYGIGDPVIVQRCYGKPKMTEEQFCEALKLRKSGISWKKIAKKFKFTENYVKMFFYYKGYKSTDFPIERKVLQRKEYKQTVKLLKKGLSCREISRKLDVYYQTVIYWKNVYKQEKEK